MSVRVTQIQVKVSEEEKSRFEKTARMYSLPLATFARFAMEHFAANKPTLRIDPFDDEEGEVVVTTKKDPLAEEDAILTHPREIIGK